MKRILMFFLFFIASFGSVAFGQKVYDDQFITFSGGQILGWHCNPDGDGYFFLHLQAPMPLPGDSTNVEPAWNYQKMQYDLHWTKVCPVELRDSIPRLFANLPLLPPITSSDNATDFRWEWVVDRYLVYISLGKSDGMFRVRVLNLQVSKIDVGTNREIQILTRFDKRCSLVYFLEQHGVWPEIITMVKNPRL